MNIALKTKPLRIQQITRSKNVKYIYFKGNRS